eukprot:765694-Hanusia_phi.AAC.2
MSQRSEDADDSIVFTILYCSSLKLAFFVSFPASSSKDCFRTMMLDEDKLSPTRWAAADKMNCKKVTTALSFLYRIYTLYSIDKLLPEMRSVVFGSRDGNRSQVVGADDPWLTCGEEKGRAGERGGGDRRISLNASQEKALRGLRGPVVMVQGPPGTGEEERRIVTGQGITAIDSLVSKLKSAGVEDILAVGSKQRMGETTVKFLMERRVENVEEVKSARRDGREKRRERRCWEKSLHEVFVLDAMKEVMMMSSSRSKSSQTPQTEGSNREQDFASDHCDVVVGFELQTNHTMKGRSGDQTQERPSPECTLLVKIS